MTIQKIQKMKMALFLIPFLTLSGFFVALFQNNIIKIKADTWPIIVNTGHLAFGTVFPGEQAEKTFIVTYDGDGESVDYRIVERYKPLPDAVVPDEYSGSISDYCQEHFEDLERCYRDLCPYIEEYSNEEEGDTVNGALISFNDSVDVWIVHLDAPAIAGNISQDHTGGIISVNGVYGCDLSIDLEISPKSSVSGCKYKDVNNNGVIDEGEEKLSGWEIQLIGCPYPPLEEGASELLPTSRINTNPEPGEVGYCSVMKTTITNSEGCYTFADLDEGDYGVSEVVRENWIQTYPADNQFYYFALGFNEDKNEIDFANFIDHQEPYCGDGIKDADEECDDGNNINGDGCSSVCKTETTTVVTGGGGGGYISLRINDSGDCVITEDGAYFSWKTNRTASTRVVCDTESNPNWGTPPNYGYTIFTDEYDLSPKVLSHGVEISGLLPGENYYCRVISSDSSNTVFEEVICSVPEEEEEEEGEIKGISDVIIPQALPKTGFGSQ